MSSTAHELLAEQDQVTRRLAQQEFRRPMVVEAGAGTGKTSILVARIVAWCFGPGWQQAAEELTTRGRTATEAEVAARTVEGVVAITFTEAAAAEMAERVAAAFADLAAGQVPVGVATAALPEPSLWRLRAIALLAAVHRLQARTIHSFCQWLLRTYPVEAGVDPAFVVDAEGSRLEELVLEVVERSLRAAFRDRQDSNWLDLVAAGIGPQEVVAALLWLVEQGLSVAELDRDPFAPAALHELLTELHEALDHFWKADRGRLARVTRGTRTTETIAVLDSLEQMLEGEMAGGQIKALADAVSGPALERLRTWGKGRFNKAEAAALGSGTGEVCATADRLARMLRGLARLRPQELQTARAVLVPLLEQVEQERRAAGLMTFTDLLTGARDLLAGSSLLCSLVRRGIRQLLVDEFQDTDRIQCELVRLLALEEHSGQGPGLFIVGDPKQSIYGWRSADLIAYQAMVDEVARAGGLIRRLSVNFRSVPAILDEVQRVVEPVMHEELGLQPPFQPLVPCPGRAAATGYTDADGRCAIEHWLSGTGAEESSDGAGPTAGTSAAATELEARTLARELVSLHEQAGQPWREMAVLLRSSGDLDTYLEALRECAVPYAVSRERQYFRRREVIEAAGLVRWLIDPSDHLALLTLLRSDVVGVPDAALAGLWRAGLADTLRCLVHEGGGSFDPLRELVAGVAEACDCGRHGLRTWPRGLLLAVEQLVLLRCSLVEEAPDRFVERLRSLWLAEASAAARFLGRFRLARLERFFYELERELVEGDGSLSSMARFLRRAVARQQESQDPATPEVTEDAVQVMTIHGAKGLDFRHVFVVQLHKQHRVAAGSELAEVLVHEGSSCYALFAWPTPAFLRAEAWAARVERAEQVRLLYVAMTRAKDRLVLAGQWPPLTEVGSPEQPRCLLDLVAHRGRSSSPPAAGAAAASWLDGAGARWLHLAQGPGGMTATARAHPATCHPVSVDRILADAARLNQARQAAARRLQQPVTMAASAMAHQHLERHDRTAEAVPPAVATTPQEVVAREVAAQEVATTVGSAVHALLETLDLEADLAGQLTQRQAAISRQLLAALPAELQPLADARLAEILDRLRHGRCLARLQELAAHVVARELPVLLPPPDDEAGVIGAVVGIADLVYRDPDSGLLVVADYKTDQVVSDDEITARATSYTSQGRTYAQALREALDLDQPPPFELWFLHPDRIIRVG